jgi:hypothetical protein
VLRRHRGVPRPSREGTNAAQGLKKLLLCLDGVTPGSSCIANAYTSNHDKLDAKDISTLHWAVLHAVDAVGLVHAMILRIQVLLFPIKTLVLSGH